MARAPWRPQWPPCAPTTRAAAVGSHWSEARHLVGGPRQRRRDAGSAHVVAHAPPHQSLLHTPLPACRLPHARAREDLSRRSGRRAAGEAGGGPGARETARRRRASRRRRPPPLCASRSAARGRRPRDRDERLRRGPRAGLGAETSAAARPSRRGPQRRARRSASGAATSPPPRPLLPPLRLPAQRSPLGRASAAPRGAAGRRGARAHRFEERAGADAPPPGGGAPQLPPPLLLPRAASARPQCLGAPGGTGRRRRRGARTRARGPPLAPPPLGARVQASRAQWR